MARRYRRSHSLSTQQILVVAGVIVALLIGGFILSVKGGNPSTAATPSVQRIVLGALDNSASLGKTPEEQAAAKRLELSILYRIVRALPKGTVGMSISTMASTTKEVYHERPKKPQVLQDLIQRLAQEPVSPATEKEPTDRKPGTYFAKALGRHDDEGIRKALKEIAVKYPNVPVVIIFLTDGGVDDPDKAKEAADYIHDHLGNQITYVACLPVHDEMRTKVTAVFKKFEDEGKFGVAGSMDNTELFETIVAKLSTPLAGSKANDF